MPSFVALISHLNVVEIIDIGFFFLLSWVLLFLHLSLGCEKPLFIYFFLRFPSPFLDCFFFSFLLELSPRKRILEEESWLGQFWEGKVGKGNFGRGKLVREIFNEYHSWNWTRLVWFVR